MARVGAQMNLRRVLRFFRPDAPLMALVFLLILLAVGANLLKPWPLAVIVDSLLGAEPLPPWLAALSENWGQPLLLAALAGSILVIHAAQGTLSAAHAYFSIRIGLRGLRRVRNEVFGWLQRLSLRFHQGTTMGDLIHRASWDTYSFQTLFQQGFVTLAGSLLSLALMVAIMAQINMPLTLLALAVIPILVAVIRLFGARMSSRARAAQEADSQVTAFVQQNIAALPLVQSYTREEHEASRFGEKTARAQRERLSQHGAEVAYGLAITVAFGLATAAITWLGARQVMSGGLTVGELLVFLAYLAQLYEPLNQLSHVGSTVTGAGAGIRRVFEILDTPEEVKDAPDARPVQSPKAPAPAPNAVIARGNVAFESVTFAYREEKPVLREVSLELAAGESAALIGPSGVGKTTLLNLLPRFFDPAQGAVRLEGVDLRELRVKDLRGQISLVLQEPVILPATVAENIAYGKPGAASDEIRAAARAAHAEEFIEKLPRQFDTIIGEGGARLSVGERQRINLARAFLKDAPILLLDEPTSALDAESERLVVRSIHDLMRGRTTLIVAHRLSTIRRVDKILVIEEGRLTEAGTHEELTRRGGYYARVVQGQAALD